MIVILGLVILVAAVIAGVAGVLANGGHAHEVTHFAVFGYHVTGSTGTLFLYGIVIGALALAGLSLLLAGARRTSRRGREARRGLARSRRETAAVSADRDDLAGQRDYRPRLHGPRRATELHRQHAGRRRHRPERQRSGPARAQPVRTRAVTHPQPASSPHVPPRRLNPGGRAIAGNKEITP